AEKTKFKDAAGNAIKDGLKDKRFKEGVAVMFLARTQDGKEILFGMKLAGDGKGGPGPGQAPEKVDLSRFKPLTEMGTDKYGGFKGGLYPDGKNERPAGHEVAGLALARKVQPLDADGKPNADGKIVLLSVGMSNTTQVFREFQRIANKDEDKNP